MEIVGSFLERTHSLHLPGLNARYCVGTCWHLERVGILAPNLHQHLTKYPHHELIDYAVEYACLSDLGPVFEILNRVDHYQEGNVGSW